MGLTTALEDLCTAIVDCPHSTPKWTETGIVVLRNANIKGGRLDLSDPSFTDEEHYLDRVRRAVPVPGDLVITREAPMGEVCMIPPGLKCCLGQRMVLLKPDAKKVHPRYLLYALQSRYVQNQILANEGTGSTVSNLRIPLLKSLRIPVKDFATQEAVVTILGAIDDKIELNTRMGRTLDDLAWATFSHSILGAGRVDVDLLASDSVLPDGWRLSTIGEECVTVLGGTPSRKVPEYWGGKVPWINSGKANEFRIIEPSERISDLGLAKSSAKLMPPRTTVVAITGATLGKVSLTEIETAANQSIVGILPSDYLPAEYIYYWVRANVDYLIARQTGGAQQHINKRDVSELPLLRPPHDDMRRYSTIVRPLLDRIRVALLENQTLVSLRHMLLPGLISGELRVHDAEQLVSEVA